MSMIIYFRVLAGISICLKCMTFLFHILYILYYSDVYDDSFFFLVVCSFCLLYYYIYFIIQLPWFCRHLHLPEVCDAFFFIISLFKLFNFCGFAGISICQKCVMLSSSVFFLILSWFFCSNIRLPVVSDVCFIFLSYLILVGRIILTLCLLTSVVFAGISICQKCAMIHSSHDS